MECEKEKETKTIICNICLGQYTKYNYNKHILTKKHITHKTRIETIYKIDL